MMPAKADPAVQADFLETKLRPRLQQAERGQRTVLFVDAAHFVYGPFLGFLWCLVRRFVRAPAGRKRYNVLAALDAVTHQVIRVTGMIYAVPEFTQHPKVIDGCSQLLAEVFGERGAHARMAYGVASLPFGSPVAIDCICQIEV